MDSLQSSMLGALEHDQRKQQVNDAKMRAVKQHVEYDDFEKLVAGAHLKPVKPKSAELASISKPFDFFVMPAYDATAAAAPSASPRPPPPPPPSPPPRRPPPRGSRRRARGRSFCARGGGSARRPPTASSTSA